MKRLLTCAVGLAVTAAAASLSLAAPAQAAGQPNILTPTSGQTVKSGYTGPVTVDFSAATPDRYMVQIDCPEQIWETYYTVTGSETGPVSFPTDRFAPAETAECQLVVTDAATHGTVGWDSATFTVAAPAVTVTTPTVSPATFYPLVRDDYRDTTTVRFKTSRVSNVTVRVKNSAGRTVRSASLGERAAGSQSWNWNGRNNSGAKVPAGRYRIWVRAVDANGADEASVPVTVATKLVTTRKALRRSGYSGSGSTSGSCFIHWDSYDSTAELDCWGGRYAQVTYGFRLASAAKDVRWHVNGERSTLDRCCQGTITKSGKRVSATRFRVRAKVTGWRAHTVLSVSVSYAITRRI